MGSTQHLLRIYSLSKVEVENDPGASLEHDHDPVLDSAFSTSECCLEEGSSIEKKQRS